SPSPRMPATVGLVFLDFRLGMFGYPCNKGCFFCPGGGPSLVTHSSCSAGKWVRSPALPCVSGGWAVTSGRNSSRFIGRRTRLPPRASTRTIHMPSLILLKYPDGPAPNKHIQLSGETQIIGRDADKCQIVIPHHAVSREHAKITVQNGNYFIEDLKSRNHTFVNSKEVAGRTALKGDDRIKICDFLFQFRDERSQKPGELPDWMKKKGDQPEEEDDNAGTDTLHPAPTTTPRP